MRRWLTRDEETRLGPLLRFAYCSQCRRRHAADVGLVEASPDGAVFDVGGSPILLPA